MAESTIGSVFILIIVFAIIFGGFYYIYKYANEENHRYRMLTKGLLFSCPNSCYCPKKKDDDEEDKSLTTTNDDCPACQDVDKNFCFNCDLIDGGVEADSLDACKNVCDTTYQCNAFRYSSDTKNCRVLYYDTDKMPGNTIKGQVNEQFGWKIKPTSSSAPGVIMAQPLFDGQSYSQKCIDQKQ